MTPGSCCRHCDTTSDLRAALQKFAHYRTSTGPPIVKEPLPNFVSPHSAPYSRIPSHPRPDERVRMSQEPEERLGPELASGLDKFHPQQDAPIRHVSAFEYLMFVIPTAEIGLHDTVARLLMANGVQLCGVAYSAWIWSGS